MLPYTNSKNYLLLSITALMVQGCIAYVDPYPGTIVHTGSQSVVETRPPFYGFDVFYDYYDRPYYVDSSRRVLYIDTKYYPYVKSHYQYKKTDYGRYTEYHDNNRRNTYPNNQIKVIDKHDDNRMETNPHNQARVIDRHDNDDNRGRSNPANVSKPDHAENGLVPSSSNKKNDAGSNNSGRSHPNTDNSHNNHSNDSGKTY